ncbi:helix-turn-helix transcriptional regulator [Oceaniglobus ichthyenteri]|uniref:helix-turn-helix transcriptional regulator n=1 Tax=Oceaniglobus ichthyenteri TaxID=2136177 RepID=UPI000D36AF9F|nr:PAS domain-containing protein [Oceaniglobus ichthyenteri]
MKHPKETVLDAAVQIAKAIQPSIGNICEIVVHDFRDLNRSVIAYEGNLTGRKIGAPITPLSLEIMADGGRTKALTERLLTTDDGRTIKSTVVALCDDDDRIVGSFCINIDVTNLRHTLHLLESIAGSEKDTSPYTFPDTLPELVHSVMEQETRRLGRALTNLDARSRREVVRSLNNHQVFAIRNSVKLVADHLGVSRATLYTDLEKVRAETGTVPST